MIEREIEGKTYKFQITRRGLREAEKQGMNLAELESKPLSLLYYLWFAALYPMPMSKTDALLDTYLDDPNCPETMENLLATFSEEFASVFK